MDPEKNVIKDKTNKIIETIKDGKLATVCVSEYGTNTLHINNTIDIKKNINEKLNKRQRDDIHDKD